jgi:CHAD domain-containing protein
MKANSNLSIRVFGAEVLLKHLEALSREMEGARLDDADIEHIHRLRVATRRLRAAIPLFECSLPARYSPGWTRQIRRLTRMLGAARDADVQIEALEAYRAKLKDAGLKPGIERLVLRLRQNRAAMQPEVVQTLDKFSQSKTLEEMQVVLLPLAAQREITYMFTPALYRLSCDSIDEKLEQFLAFDEIVPQVEKVTELHQMRIAAKRLRYTMENFASLFSGSLKEWLSPVRDAQELLGQIHDCDVWDMFLPEFMLAEERRTVVYFGSDRQYGRLEPGLAQFRSDRQAERVKRFINFNRLWEEWKRDRLWDALRRAIQAPLLKQTAIFPPPNPFFPELSDG